MKVIATTLLASMLAIPVFAETWNNVTLIDSMCAKKVKDNPDAHTRDCALQCSKSGYGILTSDGAFLKFDQKGQQEALAALKSSSKKDHLRATVTGDRKGDTIKVKSLTLD